LDGNYEYIEIDIREATLMIYLADSPETYISQLPEDRKEAFEKLRKTIKENLPEGFQETMSYGMIGFVIPHSVYPSGYHVNPKEPVPFIGLGSQKHYIALYHMGIYAHPEISAWFQSEYPKHVKTKLDMGKSCIRFKRMDSIPYDLIAELCRKITMEDYLHDYNLMVKKLEKK
jgi:uncharacterized protein YdhG (YjbR/CyaY superfamily)